MSNWILKGKVLPESHAGIAVLAGYHVTIVQAATAWRNELMTDKTCKQQAPCPLVYEHGFLYLSPPTSRKDSHIIQDLSSP